MNVTLLDNKFSLVIKVIKHFKNPNQKLVFRKSHLKKIQRICFVVSCPCKLTVMERNYDIAKKI